MNILTSLAPGLIGAALGAVATMAIGFTQGGWYTSRSAEQLAEARSTIALVDALVPFCVSQSKLDPHGAAKVSSMTTMVTDYEKRDFVMKAGWATVPGSESPNRDVANACAGVLVKARQS